MLILRIKQAETALRQGRLDEAFGLLGDAELRAHRRGQELAAELATAYLARGQAHLTAGQWAAALTDCEQAARLGGNLTAAAALRGQIDDARRADQHRQMRQADAIAAARRHLDAGDLSMADAALVQADTAHAKAGQLTQEAQTRRAKAERDLDRARAAFARQAWDEALAAAADALALHASREAQDFTGELTRAVAAEVQAQLAAGRLDRAAALLERTRPLANASLDLQEAGRVLAQAHLVMQHLAGGAFESAEAAMNRLADMLPDAAWAAEALNQLRQISAAARAVRCGPLGALAETAAASPQAAASNRLPVDRGNPRGDRLPVRHLQAQAPEDAPHADKAPAGPVVGEPVPTRFLLHVNGAGSYLVVTDTQVSIGPVSSSRRPDVGLLAEPGLPVIHIERHDDDYFLRAEPAVQVNGTAATYKMLGTGDRIALSPRCRLGFELPHAASPTAVVALEGTRLPRGDARRVVMLDRSLVIGPGRSAHVRCDGLAQPVVLHLRQGRLLCQTAGDFKAAGQVLPPSRGLPMGVPIEAGGVTFTLAAVDA